MKWNWWRFKYEATEIIIKALTLIMLILKIATPIILIVWLIRNM